jgi:hypothetical protein
MTRQISLPTLIVLAMAGIAAAAPWPLLAADGGIRQQPLRSPSAPAGRAPSRGPDADGPMRPDPAADDTFSRLRRPPMDEPVQVGASIKYRGTQYVVTDGQWYERRGRDLVAVTPPSGVLVRDLPKGHTMRWIGGVPYFYADGLYYVWREGSRRYEILQSPPSEEESPAQGAPQENRRSSP